MKASAKIDLYKQHKAEYVTPKKPEVVHLGKATYLAIEGQGEPGGEVFTDRVGALYGVAYTIKMGRKFGGQQDYAVCKLEGQWWVDGDPCDFARIPKSKWHWKLLIRTPDFIKADDLKNAIAALLKKGKAQSVSEVRLETITEGSCVQMLHVGPYDREVDTIAAMHEFAKERGFDFHGRHHEIYLSDPRRVAPEKLKTILRMPVRKNGAS